jgi:predicted membrane protein
MRVRDRDVSHFFFPWGRGWAGALDWDIALNPSVPLFLRLETGASESRLSLTDLQVRELSIKTGASATTVDLPRAAGLTRVHVESGAASVKLRVPQGVAASIQVKSALAGIHVDRTRFPVSAAGYASSDYAGAANKVEIFVETGVGSVDIY